MYLSLLWIFLHHRWILEHSSEILLSSLLPLTISTLSSLELILFSFIQMFLGFQVWFYIFLVPYVYFANKIVIDAIAFHYSTSFYVIVVTFHTLCFTCIIVIIGCCSVIIGGRNVIVRGTFSFSLISLFCVCHY